MARHQQLLPPHDELPESGRPTPPAASAGIESGPKRMAPSLEIFGSLVRDIMTRPVVTVQPTDTLQVAATLLSQKNISGMPVVDMGGKVVGVLSEKDILRTLRQKAGLTMPGGLFDLVLEPSAARQKDILTRCFETLHEETVDRSMYTPAKVLSPDTLTVQAARQMLSLGINRMPVVENGKLVGIVTRANVLTLYQGPY